MDDDPFVVVRPKDVNKKMSSYLKKQGNMGPKCPETSSEGTHHTNTTASSSSTMFSAPEQSAKTPEESSRKTKNKTDDAAIAFNSDFGDGLEFGQGVGADAFNSDHFGGIGFGGSDGFGDGDLFGSDGFGSAANFVAAFDKQQNFKKDARSKSSGSVRPPHDDRRRGGTRRHHSTDNVELLGGSTNQSPKVPSRRDRPPAGQDCRHSPNLRGDKDRSKSPPRRQKSSNRRDRRASMQHSIVNEGGKSPRPRRRASLTTATHADGSGRKVIRSTAPPRHKSVGERPRRRQLGGTTPDPPVPLHGGSNKKNWTNQRSRNQELIMNMYRGGETKKSEKGSNKNDTMGSIEADMDIMKIHGDLNGLSPGKSPIRSFIKRNVPKSPFGKSLGDDDDEETRRRGRNKEMKAPRSFRKPKPSADQGVSKPNHRDLEGRSKTTLFERVASDDSLGHIGSPGNGDDGVGGLSYSDKIMMGQQRGK